MQSFLVSCQVTLYNTAGQTVYCCPVSNPLSKLWVRVMRQVPYGQAPLCDFPCDFAIMRECDALGDARKSLSSANGCAEPHCGNRIIVWNVTQYRSRIITKKVQNFDKVVSQYRKIARENRIVEPGLYPPADTESNEWQFVTRMIINWATRSFALLE